MREPGRPPPLPRRVLAVDEETRWDSRWTLVALIVISMLVFVGICASLAMGHIGLALLLMFAAAPAMIIAIVSWTQSHALAKSHEAGYESSAPVSYRPADSVLDYSSVPRGRSTVATIAHGCALALLIAGGIVLLLFGLCVATLVVGGALSGPWPPK